MVANNRPYRPSGIFIVLVICWMFGSAYALQTPQDETPLLQQAAQAVLRSSSAYADQIERCDRIRLANPAPILDQTQWHELPITREQAITALAFLHGRNDFLERNHSKMA